MTTKEKILIKALEMFNQKGIEYVGMRELAAILDIRVSNITYYFPTKDELVNALSLELRELNTTIMVNNKSNTLLAFLEMYRAVFQNQVKYRSLLLSFVHLVTQNKIMAEEYNNTQKIRESGLLNFLNELVHAGYLKITEETEIVLLQSTLSLISRFWISEAAISCKHLNSEQQINHYLSLIAKLFSPFTTSKGKKEIQTFVTGLNKKGSN